MNVPDSFSRLYDVIRTLRSPNGCPWDQKQTPQSLRSSLVEETYEAIDAIDSGDDSHVSEELGDLYLLVTFLAVMYEEDDSFTVAETLSGICEKLVRRHPHVFGDASVADADEVLEQWNRIKTEDEGRPRKDQFLDTVSDRLPSLERSFALQRRAAEVGFDWPDASGVFDKLAEETLEVRSELENKAPHQDLEAEVGDLLFSAINVARYLGVDPSIALHKTNQKFKTRFADVENKIRERGKNLKDTTLAEMEEIWNTHRKQ